MKTEVVEVVVVVGGVITLSEHGDKVKDEEGEKHWSKVTEQAQIHFKS